MSSLCSSLTRFSVSNDTLEASIAAVNCASSPPASRLPTRAQSLKALFLPLVVRLLLLREHTRTRRHGQLTPPRWTPRTHTETNTKVKRTIMEGEGEEGIRVTRVVLVLDFLSVLTSVVAVLFEKHPLLLRLLSVCFPVVYPVHIFLLLLLPQLVLVLKLLERQLPRTRVVSVRRHTGVKKDAADAAKQNAPAAAAAAAAADVLTQPLPTRRHPSIRSPGQQRFYFFFFFAFFSAV